jgi:hypothetical protein
MTKIKTRYGMITSEDLEYYSSYEIKDLIAQYIRYKRLYHREKKSYEMFVETIIKYMTEPETLSFADMETFKA